MAAKKASAIYTISGIARRRYLMDAFGLMENRIREWRTRRKMSRRQLAELVGCHQQTIVKLEDGTIRLGEQWLEPLAKGLNVAPADLLPIEYSQLPGTPVRLVPVISWSAAGLPLNVVETHIDDSTERISVAYQSATLLAVRVCGNSMNIVASDGSYAIYDYQDRELVDKGYYLVRIDGDVCFKKYRNTGGPPRLEPESTEAHDTLFPTNPVDVIGRVIEIVKRL